MSASTPNRRVRTWLAAAALAAVLTTGCTAGDWRYDAPPAAGVQADAGPVKARNFLVVADESGQAAVLGTIVASEDVTLTGVAVAAEDENGERGEPVMLDLGGEEIRRNGVLKLDAGNATVEGAELLPGRLAHVALQFEDGTQLVLQTPVMSAEHADYDEVLEGA
ncbi:hypothetical protein LKO27_00825 [Tessaracoccus sp. OS52]|uniref:hypothetical protein n=1 Tax=Tessaracoccus sp. OS52 TaxID=2886691 RepID=UPI001D12F1BD|nr:hypothetical protein [Tessaracoccus sp. OS52]MCC2591974.1 hypothetical protein [Tessaracoccus sp. OS52]